MRSPTGDPDGLPHVLFGVGALILLALAALLLVLLAGHVPAHPGAMLLVIIGAPTLLALSILAAKRLRAAHRRP